MPCAGLLDDVHRFNPDLVLWEDLTSLLGGGNPSPRYCNILFSTTGVLYSSGGLDNSGGFSARLNI